MGIMISKRKTRIQIHIFFTAVFLTASVLSGALLPFLKLSLPFFMVRCSPDLTLSVCVLTAFLTDKKTAAVYGIVFGFLYDTLIGTPFSVSVIVCFLGAYFSGMLFEGFAKLTLISALITAAPIFLLRSTVTFFNLIAYSHKVSIFSILAENVLCEYIINILVFIPLYFAVKYLYALFDKGLKWKQL